MKETIHNRKQQKVVVLVEKAESQEGLAFVMHGLGGFKEQPHLQTIADSLREHGYTVVRFDTTNTVGESNGKYEDATATNYYEDLEDVIEWSRAQQWYEEPFVLVGHSIGGLCVALFAEKHPDQVKALAPLGTVVSGALSWETYSKEELEDWQKTGVRTLASQSKPGMIKMLKWSHMEDRLKYNLLPQVSRLTMPVLMVVGEQDVHTPPAHQKILYVALSGKKELHIVSGAPHTFVEEAHLEELKRLFTQWIRQVD